MGNTEVQDESAFLDELLAGIDTDDFFNAIPTPQKPKICSTPSKHTRTPQRSPKKVTCVDLETVDFTTLLDGAEDWNDDDFVTPQKLCNSSKLRSPAKSIPSLKFPEKCSQTYVPDPATRCIVNSIFEVQAHGMYEKHLTVSTIPSEVKSTVILGDDWAQTDVRTGDIINAIGHFASTASGVPSISITAQSNLLILSPDILITATALSNAPECRRKPLLTAMLKSTTAGDGMTPSLVWGNMVHEIVQEYLQYKLDYSEKETMSHGKAWLEAEVDRIVTKSLLDLYKIGVDVELAKVEIAKRTAGLVHWMDKYVGSVPKANAILSNTRSNEDSLLAINRIHAIEEDIWSPKYGLKGKLDASVSIVIDEGSHKMIDTSKAPTSLKKWFTSLEPGSTSHPAPLEIKTGRANAGMEHRAQTMLYTLLTAERYGVKVPSGLLYYTQSDEVIRVPVSRNELRGLICARNEMAAYMMRRIKQSDLGTSSNNDHFLPPTIDDERACKRCYAADACMLYRRAVENVVDTSSPIAELYEMKASHLTPAQCEFFKKWETLLSLEEHDLFKLKRELWVIKAEERERQGRCFSGMKLTAGGRSIRTSSPFSSGDLSSLLINATKLEDEGSLASAKIHRYTYSFIRALHGSDNPDDSSLLNGHMSLGDAITVSVEPDLLALAKGFILRLTPREVVVGVDSNLDLVKIRETLHLQLPSLSMDEGRDIIFRIDKDEMSSGMSRVRDNLAQLFYHNGDKRRLELVVDMRPPIFASHPAGFYHTHADGRGYHSQKLNVDQKMAMDKVLRADDYALILGMPGTGKTTLIAAIIATLVRGGKTVLVTSYTHSAVDNILLKLKEDFTEGQVLRIGNGDKVHPDAKCFTLDGRPRARTIAMLEDQLMRPSVVATTCLSIDHPLFSRRSFDYCIVDEASQITLPTCLGPLRHADKFILVGDHFQLPPLVRNKHARKGGLDVSLFRTLSSAHPQAVVDLTLQYRMNEDIMCLSNKLIYSDRLYCGSEEVRKKSLKIPDEGQFLKELHSHNIDKKECWLERVLSEDCKAVFIDTDNLPAPDSRVGSLLQNTVEAELVRQLTETLIRSGVREEQIGIISLLRQQIKLISYLLEERKEKGVEILTADKSQGRDKDVIIISMVRSNTDEQVGDLLKDWRRMNVSFTRAKSKLVIFGSRKTLKGVVLLEAFFELMESKGWVLELSKGDEHRHDIPGAPSQSLCKGKASTVNKSEMVPSLTGRKRAGSVEIVYDSMQGEDRLAKRMKATPLPRRAAMSEEGLTRGRPILLDLMNEDI